MKIITIVNEKGGVGKTATAVNLAYEIFLRNNKVLLIDLDPGGFASSALGINYINGEPYHNQKRILETSFDIFRISENKYNKFEINGITLCPAGEKLSWLDANLAGVIGKEKLLKKFLSKYTGFDFVIIDCKGSLGILSINAMVASTHIIAVTQPEFSSLEGVVKLNNTVELIKDNYNDKVNISGVVVAMYDERLNIHKESLIKIKESEQFRAKLYKTIIPRNVSISEAIQEGEPVSKYKPNSKGAIAYKALANELIERIKNDN